MDPKRYGKQIRYTYWLRYGDIKDLHWVLLDPSWARRSGISRLHRPQTAKTYLVDGAGMPPKTVYNLRSLYRSELKL